MENLPPVLRPLNALDIFEDVLPDAQVGDVWTAEIEAIDSDGSQFFWQIVQAPEGVALTPAAEVTSDLDGYHNVATLSWTPVATALADSEIVVRVQDSWGGVALKHFKVAVNGGNHAPVVSSIRDIVVTEGSTVTLQAYIFWLALQIF